MLNKNIDIWQIVFYDKESLLNKLNFYNIKIYNFKEIKKYTYSFETQRKNRKLIKDNFKESKIIRKKGFINCFESGLKKTTFLCILISLFSLYDVSKRIWKIEIDGDYQVIEERIKEELYKNNLIISNYYPSSNKLKEIENIISLNLSKEIEFLEVRRRGGLISVRYQKRREKITLPQKKKKLYATKDGLIKYFEIQSGVKQVKENDYVRKGDLLVSDVVETSGGDFINVGTLGSVYANTFYMIEVSLNHDEEDTAIVFSKMLDKAKLKISEYISKGERIEIERVLNYSIDDKEGKMKVYYMLLEDITI